MKGGEGMKSARGGGGSGVVRKSRQESDNGAKTSRRMRQGSHVSIWRKDILGRERIRHRSPRWGHA